jgi:hypothetical protein
VRVRTHWPYLLCVVSLIAASSRFATRTRTRDCGSRLAKRLAQRLSRRRALLSRKEVETRLNCVPCHHRIFVSCLLQSTSHSCQSPTINKARFVGPPHMPIHWLLSVCASLHLYVILDYFRPSLLLFEITSLSSYLYMLCHIESRIFIQ